ncbi:hypothetical protein ABKN59_002091 [Abortiporus biennis]
MVYQWEPETQYNVGDVVEYEGHKYKIVQPHRSQSDWAPPLTPALWARLPEEYHGGEHHEHHEQPQQQQPQQPYVPPQGGYDEKPWDQQTKQQVPVHHEEQKKSWDDIDPERKKQLELGGGLVAGLAAIGAGYFAYKHHEKSEEEKKAQVWGLQTWLKDAQARTEDFHRNGPRGPATWVLAHGTNIPQGAFPGGEENGEPVYISRAFYEGGLTVGKASSRLKKGAVIGFAHDEIDFDTYEVLLADPRGVRWVSTHGKLNLAELGARPVEGGREPNGTPLFIAQAHHNNSILPGKCSEKLKAAFIPYKGTEKEVSDYRVLCYA